MGEGVRVGVGGIGVKVAVGLGVRVGVGVGMGVPGAHPVLSHSKLMASTTVRGKNTRFCVKRFIIFIFSLAKHCEGMWVKVKDKISFRNIVWQLAQNANCELEYEFTKV